MTQLLPAPTRTLIDTHDTQPDAQPDGWIASLPTGTYPDLKRRIVQAKLLAKQPRYYTLKIAWTLALLALSLTLLVTVHHTWFQMLNALFLTVVFVQIAFLGHDVGHRQVIRPGRICSLIELLVGNALIGVDSTWWMDKHNRHHAHPNRNGYDPDISLPIAAFSVAQARAMNAVQRLFVRHQHLLIPALLPLEGIVLRFSGLQYLIQERGRRWVLELLLIVAHIALYGWLVFHSLGLYPGIAFVAINQLTFGLYMSSVFAPNHKGMLMLEEGDEVDFLLEQVLTSRNVSGGTVTDFVYGGLNYQIEHHLFPSMPRNRLRHAQPIVRGFCDELNIPYCATSALRSYRAIFAHMHAVGASTMDR